MAAALPDRLARGLSRRRRALGIAQGYDWPTSYLVMAALAGIGILTTLLVLEPRVC